MKISSHEHSGVRSGPAFRRSGLASFFAAVLLATGGVLGFTSGALEAHAVTTETKTWVAGQDSTGPNRFDVPVGATNLRVKMFGGAGGDGYT